MHVLLVSPYDLGHQPQGGAELVGHLTALGHSCELLDLALMDDPYPQGPAQAGKVEAVVGSETDRKKKSDLIVIFVQMHTSARLAREYIISEGLLNSPVPIALSGLYAGVLSKAFAEGSFAYISESDDQRGLLGYIASSAQSSSAQSSSALMSAKGSSATPSEFATPSKRLPYIPLRDSLEPLSRYRTLRVGDVDIVSGYVEASKGCRHKCTHCPVPIAWGGRISINDVDEVIYDIAAQVDAGAAHISFGDPDFFNAPIHSLKVLRRMHEKFPDLTFDATIKIEHICRHTDVWDEMRELGCLYVISAVESLSAEILKKLEKGHNRADLHVALQILRDASIDLHPSLLPFTPWTKREDILDILEFVHQEGLDNIVEPVQLGIRLLLPPGSPLIQDPSVQSTITHYDPDRFSYEWRSPDSLLDEVASEIGRLASLGVESGEGYETTFAKIREMVYLRFQRDLPLRRAPRARNPLAPLMSESWFCCSEPNDIQLGSIRRAP